MHLKNWLDKCELLKFNLSEKILEQGLRRDPGQGYAYATQYNVYYICEAAHSPERPN